MSTTENQVIPKKEKKEKKEKKHRHREPSESDESSHQPTVEEETIDGEEDDEDGSSYDSEDYSDDQGSSTSRLDVDLSNNEFYQGLCTLLEDEQGNNILQYISLLHTELIGINQSLMHLEKIGSSLSKISKAVETYVSVVSDKKVEGKKEEKHEKEGKDSKHDRHEKKEKSK